MNKWLLRISLGVLAMFALLYLFVLSRSYAPVTVNDADLRLVRASIPEGSNSFDVLETAGHYLWWPGTQSEELDDLAKDTNWDDSLANTALANNREALAGWDAAANLPDLQVPEVTKPEDLLPYLPIWKNLAQLASVRENMLMRAGKDQEAFDQMVRGIQVSRRMQNGRGVLICHLVGMAVENIGLNQIQHWAGRTHLNATQLKDCIRQLAFDPGEAGIAYANSIKAEYQCQLGTLDGLRRGKRSASSVGAVYPSLSHFFPTFNYSQTEALFAHGSLLLVNAAPQHYKESKLPDFDATRPGLVSMVLSGNAVGQILYYMAMPALARTLAKKSQLDTHLQATRVILALRAYQLEHGNLPSNLSALVPAYLDKVPLDDFDGQPLRYSVSRKIVYSVGANLKDDGGDDRRVAPSNQPLDLVYRFDF